MVVVDLLGGILVRRVLVELKESHGLEVLLGIEDELAATQSHDGGRPAAARVPDGAVGAAETENIIAGERPLLDEQFAHGHHLPFDLLTLGAEIVVLAGLRVGIDLGDLEHAALLPSLGQVADVGHPVVFERRDHARGPAVEAGRDVLLSVGDEIALRGLRIDVHVHAETEARGFRDILHHLHLRAVVAHAIDVEAFPRRLDLGGDAVDQRILAALGAVDPLEALRRIRAREGAQMMRDRVVVAVVPIRDPGERPAGIEVHRVGAAAHLGRHQKNPVAEASAAHIRLRIDQFAIDGMALGFGRG